MRAIFREILVTLEPEPDSHELVDCMKELESIHEELGDNHEHAVFAQIFSHKNSRAKYYLTGMILTPDQAHRIKAILAEKTKGES